MEEKGMTQGYRQLLVCLLSLHSIQVVIRLTLDIVRDFQEQALEGDKKTPERDARGRLRTAFHLLRPSNIFKNINKPRQKLSPTQQAGFAYSGGSTTKSKPLLQQKDSEDRKSQISSREQNESTQPEIRSEQAPSSTMPLSQVPVSSFIQEGSLQNQSISSHTQATNNQGQGITQNMKGPSHLVPRA